MGVLLDGRAQETGIRRIGTDATLLLVLNAYHDVVRFKLPLAASGSKWVSLIDTNNNEVDLKEFSFGHEYEVTGRSLLLFVLQPTPTKGRDTNAERSFRQVVEAVDEAHTRAPASTLAARHGPSAPQP
jgi:glycogen operon protein